MIVIAIGTAQIIYQKVGFYWLLVGVVASGGVVLVFCYHKTRKLGVGGVFLLLLFHYYQLGSIYEHFFPEGFQQTYVLIVSVIIIVVGDFLGTVLRAAHCSTRRRALVVTVTIGSLTIACAILTLPLNEMIRYTFVSFLASMIIGMVVGTNLLSLRSSWAVLMAVMAVWSIVYGIYFANFCIRLWTVTQRDYLEMVLIKKILGENIISLFFFMGGDLLTIFIACLAATLILQLLTVTKAEYWIIRKLFPDLGTIYKQKRFMFTGKECHFLWGTTALSSTSQPLLWIEI